MSRYRILSFDGGGIRGALTTTLLKRLCNEFPNLIEKADLFAGTSTGSFIALGLAYGKTPSELCELFSFSNCRFIFNPTYRNIARPRYNNKNLIKVLKSVFPMKLLLTQLDNYVVVPSFRTASSNSETWSPVLFNNFPDSDTKDESVIKVALASSAAPAYFPSHQNYIDGGVIANNPSIAAISIANEQKYKPTQIDKIYLLSIGTGFNPNEIKVDTEDWGVLQWMLNPSPPPAFPMLKILTQGNVQADAYFSSQLLGERFFRLNPVLPKPIDLDEYTQIPRLVILAENVELTSAVNWINQNWI